MYFKGEDPLGRQISVTEEGPNGIDLRAQTIVGVSATVRQRDIQGGEPDAVVFVPYFTGPNLGRTVAVMVRTSGGTAAAVPLIRQAVLALDADIPVFNVRTMDELLAQRRWQYRVFGGMFADLRRDRTSPRRRRPVRGDGVLGNAAHTGNRRAHGARRTSRATWSGCFSVAP